MENKSVAILLATYNPREDWLVELLDSLNSQTYPNLFLYVRDDASPSFALDRLKEVVAEHITSFPYTIAQNEKNMGSNETFSQLVRDCHDEFYISFCDQDDVWHPDKIENTVRLLEESELHPILACANVSIIDGDGAPVAPTIDSFRKRHVFLRGNGLAKELIYRNFAMGCTMIIERAHVLTYLPIPKEIVHDHYIAFRAAAEGAIDYLAEPQMKYRVYGGNQTGVMSGVETKEDYLEKRICIFEKRIEDFSKAVKLPELDVAREWCEVRKRNFYREKGSFRALWKMKDINKATSLFELFALRFPNFLFRFAIHQNRKGRF